MSPEAPLNLYAIHKWTSEKYLQYYASAHGVPSVALRFPNLYGPVPNAELWDRVVVNRIILRALCGSPLRLFRNHACKRDYLFIEDAVAAVLLAGANGRSMAGRPFVLGTGTGETIAGMVNLIADRVALRGRGRPEVRVDESEQIEPVEWRQFVGDAAPFRETTGWRPRVLLAAGIDRTLDYFLANARPAPC